METGTATESSREVFADFRAMLFELSESCVDDDPIVLRRSCAELVVKWVVEGVVKGGEVSLLLDIIQEDCGNKVRDFVYRELHDRRKEIELAKYQYKTVHDSNNNNGKKKLQPTSIGRYITEEPPIVDAVISDTFDVGDKVVIIGPAKVRKSFFTLQLCFSLATGRPFMEMEVPRPRRVLLCQLEVQEAHFWRRCNYMAKALEMEEDEGILDLLWTNLQILNGRGAVDQVEDIIETIPYTQPEVVIIDPIYKLMEGDENAVKDWRPLLKKFDNVCQQYGAAIVYVHHDAKGLAGLRTTTDRGSGSGIIGRDYDCAFIVTPQADGDDVIVVEQNKRNYRKSPAFCLEWADYKFQMSDEAPVVQTRIKANKSPAAQNSQKLEAEALLIIDDLRRDPYSHCPDIEVSLAAFKEGLKRQVGVGRDKGGKLIKQLISDGLITKGSSKQSSRRGLHLTDYGEEKLREVKDQACVAEMLEREGGSYDEPIDSRSESRGRTRGGGGGEPLQDESERDFWDKILP